MLENKSTVVRTTENHQIKLTSDDIRDLIRSKYGEDKVPDHAEIFVTVPGGGDWSGLGLGIDDDSPVTIRWTEIHEGRDNEPRDWDGQK